MIKELRFEFEKDLFLSYEEATLTDFHKAEQIFFLNKDAIGKSLMEFIRKAEEDGLMIMSYFKIPVNILENPGHIHSLEFYIRDFNQDTVFVRLCKSFHNPVAA